MIISETIFFIVSAVVFGCIIGSFLNVVIGRIPVMMQRELENYQAKWQGREKPHSDVFNLFFPGSFCDGCKKPLTIMEKIPVVSFFLLRGKCKNCRHPIPVQYPLIEILAGSVAGILVWRYGPGLFSLGLFFCLCLITALALIDLRTSYLPDGLTYTLLWSGLFVNVNHGLISLQEAVVAAGLAYVSLYLFNFLYCFFSGKMALAHGDLKFFSAIGAWFGVQALPWTIAGASSLCLLFHMYLKMIKGISTNEKPFGPFLAIASIAFFLVRECWFK